MLYSEMSFIYTISSGLRSTVSVRESRPSYIRCNILSKELFDSANACHAHILGNLHCIGAPWSNHFPAWPYKAPFYRSRFQWCRTIEKPYEFLGFFLCEFVVGLYGIDYRRPFFKVGNHLENIDWIIDFKRMVFIVMLYL